MRLIFIPEELTPFHLSELREIPPTLRDIFGVEVRKHTAHGQFDNALVALDGIQTVASADRDRHTIALTLLYQAEIHRRTQHWEDALDCARQALQWLTKQVTPIAVYNTAIALSFEGLIHFILHADDKALHTFTRAQEALVESERFWAFEHNLSRVAQCQNLSRWMTNLLDLRSRLQFGDWVMIVPVYELLADYTPVCTGVREILPFQASPPAEVLSNFLPPHLIPVQLDTLPFLQLRPDVQYLAIKVPADGDFVRYSQAGDILLVEAVTPVPLTREVTLGQDEPFVRRTNGRIVFSPNSQETEGFVGIPRVLIRGEEDEDERE